jgi:hypothetical protein
MANANKYGFRWVRAMQGSTVPKPQQMRVASGYQAAPGAVNVDLNIGDPVIMVSDGTVALAAAGNATFGVVVGIKPYWNATKGRLEFGTALPGGTTYTGTEEQVSTVHVLPVAGQVFEAVCDDGTTAILKATFITYIGENVDISINQVSGSRLASPKLHITGHGTSNALVWRIVDVGQGPDADFTVINAPLLVTCNLVQQAPYLTTGV